MTHRQQRIDELERELRRAHARMDQWGYPRWPPLPTEPEPELEADDVDDGDMT